MKIVKWLCLLLVVVCSGAHAQTPTITSNGVVAVKPSVCPSGFPAIGSVNNDGSVNCVAAGNAAGPSYGPNAVNPAQVLNTYNAKFDVWTVSNATVTNGSNIVSCPSTNCFFGSTHTCYVGEPFFAMAGGNLGLSGPYVTFGGLNQTTISSCDSAQQIHVVGNSNTTATGAALIFWGDDDGPALVNASKGGGCGTSLTMPGGFYFFSVNPFPAIAGCTPPVNPANAYLGQTISGQGLSTIGIPLPSYTASLSGCVGQVGSHIGCIGNYNVVDYKELSFWGGGQSGVGAQANTALFVTGSATSVYRVGLEGWWGSGAGGSTLFGTTVMGATDYLNVIGINFFGSRQIDIESTSIELGNSFISGTTFTNGGGCGVNTGIGSSVDSVSNIIGTCVSHSGSLTSRLSTFLSNSGDSCFLANTNSVAQFLGLDSICPSPGATAVGILFQTTGATVYACNSTISGGTAAGGAAISMNSSTTNVFIDQCPNTITESGSGVILAAAGTINGSASATGVPSATGNWGLTSGWGTSSVASASGDSHRTLVSITGAAGSAGPVLTWTFPKAYPIVAPKSCTLIQVGGTFGILTKPVVGTPTLTSVTFTFSGTPAANTYTFDASCGP
jgi:hypothetical protein